MFDLTKTEKVILITLISSLAVGLWYGGCRRSGPAVNSEIRNFDIARPGEDNPDIYSHPLEGRININEAGVDELMKLKGIGRVLAQRIADYRSSKGPFTSAEELKNVKGVGAALFEGIKDEISVE